jgi:hypothetical protein
VVVPPAEPVPEPDVTGRKLCAGRCPSFPVGAGDRRRSLVRSSELEEERRAPAPALPPRSEPKSNPARAASLVRGWEAMLSATKAARAVGANPSRGPQRTAARDSRKWRVGRRMREINRRSCSRCTPRHAQNLAPSSGYAAAGALQVISSIFSLFPIPASKSFAAPAWGASRRARFRAPDSPPGLWAARPCHPPVQPTRPKLSREPTCRRRPAVASRARTKGCRWSKCASRSLLRRMPT